MDRQETRKLEPVEGIGRGRTMATYGGLILVLFGFALQAAGYAW
nr:hypothetical protein [uncultured Sphingomonas sp.]